MERFKYNARARASKRYSLVLFKQTYKLKFYPISLVSIQNKLQLIICLLANRTQTPKGNAMSDIRGVLSC